MTPGFAVPVRGVLAQTTALQDGTPIATAPPSAAPLAAPCNRPDGYPAHQGYKPSAPADRRPAWQSAQDRQPGATAPALRRTCRTPQTRPASRRAQRPGP